MSRRSVVVLPGGQYGPHSPLLMFAADAAERHGAEIHPVWWDDYDRPLTLTPQERGPWVVPQARRAIDVAGAQLVVGKSLGSYSAPMVAERGLPAIWLTPDLTSSWVVDGLRAATAPILLVGGTADSLWDPDLARDLSPHLLEIDGANHGMYVPGPLAASAAVLGQVATAVEEFLDQLWS